jgi:RNA polymerase sigma-70 factor (sigma-E family)
MGSLTQGGRGTSQSNGTISPQSRLNGPVHVSGEFDQWVRHHWDALVRIARVVSGSPDLAEDVLQDALIDIYPRWNQLAHSNPMGYVVRVMSSKTANRRRTAWARRVVTFAEAPETEDGRPSATATVGDRIDIERALRQLKPQQRAIIAMHYLMDWSVSDIADALDVPTGTVTSDLTRGRQALRRQLGGGNDGF